MANRYRGSSANSHTYTCSSTQETFMKKLVRMFASGKHNIIWSRAVEFGEFARTKFFSYQM